MTEKLKPPTTGELAAWQKRAEEKEWEDGYNRYPLSAHLGIMAAAVPRLVARVRELEAALRPFAEYGIARGGGDSIHGQSGVLPDCHSIVEFGSVAYGDRGYKITIGDCRRAREVLGP